MSQPFPAIARLRQAVPGGPPPTDAELLARFTASRDEDSFRELVRRHGPLVLAVCRRVTGNREDADDAFQAAFLVLARRADRVWSGSPLGGWLYGVAVKVARKAAARSARHRSRETALVEPIDVPDRPPAFDPETVRVVLDEVARLSDAYRAAVVLCELEGRPRSAAALELGIAEGTLSSRLAAARKVLARRFRDRGLAPAILAAVAGSASCPVLAADAARLAGASASPAPHVIGLSKAVMRTGFLSYRVLAPVAALLAVVAVVVSAADPEKPQPAVAAVAVQPPAGTILLREFTHPRERYRFATLTPDGKTETEFATPKDWPDTTSSASGALRSPDGKRIVLTAVDTRPRKRDGTDPSLFPSYLCAFPDGKGLTPFGGDYEPAYWARDGGTLVVREYPPDHDTNPNDIGKFVSIDMKTGKRTDLPIPKDHWLHDQSPDGKHFLTVGTDPTGKLKGRRLFLLDRDGKMVRPLTDESMYPGPARFGPDGKWALLRAAPRSAKSIPGTLATKLYRTGIENPKPELLIDIPDSLGVMGSALSPDGKWVAFDRHPRVSGSLNPKKMHDPEAQLKDEVEFAVVVVGLDGKNPRTIRSVKTRKPFSVQLHVIDWR